MHLSENSLLDFSQGLLSLSETEGVEAHLDACSQCRGLVAAWLRVEPSNEETPSDALDEVTLPKRGEAVERYLIIDPLGVGGMGVVFSAYDSVLDRKVALKFLHVDRHLADPEKSRQRQRREAQALARVSHPNVVAVHDVGIWKGQVFLAMEFVDGQDLATALASSPRDLSKIVHWFRDAGNGLAAVHAAGLTHCDFKATNVLVDVQSRVRVTDLGLARAESATQSPHHQATELNGSLTQTGALRGTPAYMAPEQHRGEPVDARTDQFSYCVALYEALYGELPFGVLALPELARAVLAGRLRPPPEGSDVPPWLRSALVRGLEVDPADRFASMVDLVGALDEGQRRRRTQWRWATGAALCAAALATGLYFISPQQLYCRGVETQLETEWNAGVRGELRQTFIERSPAFGARAWDSVEAVLNRYARTWLEVRTEACLATRVRGEQSDPRDADRPL